MITLKYISGFYSVVLLGSFNPFIFHPLWLLKKGLIAESDVVSKEIIINSQISQYPIGDWMKMIVTPNRCEFKVEKQEKLIIMKDLIIGTLNALPEIPIVALGINRGNIIDLSDEISYYNFGAKLSALNMWSDNFNNARLYDIIIENNDTIDDNTVRRRMQIKSTNSQENKYCIDVNLNNHYIGKNQDVPFAITIINTFLESDMRFYDQILQALVKRMNQDE